MPRNGGSVVNLAGRWVRDRNGVVYSLDRLEVTDGCLFHARPIEGSAYFSYHERWILPRESWVINRFRWHEESEIRMDWYIETEVIEVRGDEWHVHDGFIDVRVFEGSHATVEDVHELAEALETGDIPVNEAARVLTAYQRLMDALHERGFSGAQLLADFALGLPA